MDSSPNARAVALLEDLLTLGAVVIAVQFYLALLPYSAAVGIAMVVATWAGLVLVRGGLRSGHRAQGPEPAEAEYW
jgi:hypothetical protein